MNGFTIVRDKARRIHRVKRIVCRYVIAAIICSVACQQQVNRVGCSYYHAENLEDYAGDGTELDAWFVGSVGSGSKDTGFMIPRV